jgi:hypothetical protein
MEDENYFNEGDENNSNENDYFEDEYEVEDSNENEMKMKQGIKDIERTGNRNLADCSQYIDKKQNKKFLSDIETFCKNINGIALDIINNSNPKLLSILDLQHIMENIKNLSNPEYKNPTCYILGYYVASGSKISLNIKKLRQVFKMLYYSEFTDENEYIVNDSTIQEPDIIRYGRLWININKLNI